MPSKLLEGRIRNAAELLDSIAPGASCEIVDEDVICFLPMSDGRSAGELIPVAELSPERLRAVGERLRLYSEGLPVAAVQEFRVRSS